MFKHQRRVLIRNQSDFYRSPEALHCSLTDWVFGDLRMRILCLDSSRGIISNTCPPMKLEEWKQADTLAII